jgi:hypothetical protein
MANGRLSWVRDPVPPDPPGGGEAVREAPTPPPDGRSADPVAVLAAAAPRLPPEPVLGPVAASRPEPIDPDELRRRVGEALALLRVGPTSRGRRSARNRVDHALEAARRELGRAAQILGPSPRVG